jgi:predicted hydrocarbon binding protein
MQKELKDNFKKTIERLKSLEGNIRGCCLKSMVDALLEAKEEKFLPAIQQKLTEYGFEEDLRKIGALKWYPVAFIIASIFSFYEVLNWEESDIKEAGRNCPNSSAQILFRLSVYTISFEKVFQKLSYFWQKLVGLGELESVELNEEEKYGIVRIKKFPIHPLYCVFIKGFGEGFGKLLIKSEKVSVEETKCIHKGDKYHEFVVRW